VSARTVPSRIHETSSSLVGRRRAGAAPTPSPCQPSARRADLTEPHWASRPASSRTCRVKPKSPGGHTGRSNTVRGKYDGELGASDRVRRTTRRGAGTGDLAARTFAAWVRGGDRCQFRDLVALRRDCGGGAVLGPWHAAA
jgi:hypothetical protein